jgi:hypothetical protein
VYDEISHPVSIVAGTKPVTVSYGPGREETLELQPGAAVQFSPGTAPLQLSSLPGNGGTRIDYWHEFDLMPVPSHVIEVLEPGVPIVVGLAGTREIDLVDAADLVEQARSSDRELVIRIADRDG